MATRDQREKFGRRLRELRSARGLSLADMARALTAAGQEVSYQTVSAWEKGEYAPRAPATVAKIEALLGADGELVELLGLASGPTLVERVRALEERVRALESSPPGPARRGR